LSARITLDGFIAGLHGEMDWMEEFFFEVHSAVRTRIDGERVFLLTNI
jgi:hypothetical protein